MFSEPVIAGYIIIATVQAKITSEITPWWQDLALPSCHQPWNKKNPSRPELLDFLKPVPEWPSTWSNDIRLGQTSGWWQGITVNPTPFHYLQCNIWWMTHFSFKPTYLPCPNYKNWKWYGGRALNPTPFYHLQCNIWWKIHFSFKPTDLPGPNYTIVIQKTSRFTE